MNDFAWTRFVWATEGFLVINAWYVRRCTVINLALNNNFKLGKMTVMPVVKKNSTLLRITLWKP